MGSHHPIRKSVTPEPTVIPDKLYFRIGDVARLCQVPAYVLRFWETEFPSLKPNKGGTGQRLYRKRDVEMALRIKSLLYDQGYTIPGARQVFKAESKAQEAGPTVASAPVVESQPAQALAVQPVEGPELDRGEVIRRRAQQETHLRALREDLLTMLAMLRSPSRRQSPAAALEAPAATDGPITSKTLRPRLVLEPRPPTQRAVPHTARSHPSTPDPLQLQQRDLFAFDSPEIPE